MTQIRIPNWAAWLIAGLIGLILIAAAVVSILLVPVVLAIALVGSAVRLIVTGGRSAVSDRRQCRACGFWMTGQGERGVCPNCNTIFGIDVTVRHDNVEREPVVGHLLPPPPDSAGPDARPGR